MGAYIKFHCEDSIVDSLTVRESENQLSVNFWDENGLVKEITLTKEDCELLIFELNKICKKLNND